MTARKGALKVAFYAPLKPPHHPQPSGDRLISQLLYKALQYAGYEVRLISDFRSRDATGDSGRQHRMIQLGERLATRLLKRWQTEGYQPDLVFCYHNYYKAPDLIGPHIAERLNIPYWVGEASWAQKRASGPWAPYHLALARGLMLAKGCFVLNPNDDPGIKQALSPDARVVQLPAFLDLDTLNNLCSPHDHAPKPPNAPLKLVAVAMLRPGDKLHSLVLLAHALTLLNGAFHLHIIGDGKAIKRAQSLFIGLPVSFEGVLEGAEMRRFVGSCDLLVWPAVNEAIGMALLEAQSCGVPVLAGREGGTSSVVSEGNTGELVEPRNAQSFALALQRLLDRPDILRKYRAKAAGYVQDKHSMSSAASVIKHAIEQN